MYHRCHYETLGVSKDAPIQDIKKAFRELSMQTHPDVAKDKNQAERFKQIAEAYRVLSNKTDRACYDADVMSSPFRRTTPYGGQQDYHHNPHARKSSPRSPHNTTMANEVLERIFHPRTFFLTLTLGIATFWITRSYQETSAKERIKRHGGAVKPMVEAWKNPLTGKWELPAPWDPTYQKLQPTLQFVPREQVQRPT